MVSTSTKFTLNKRTLSKKSVSTPRNEAFDKKSFSIIRKNCFRYWEQKKWKKIGLHLILKIVPTSRKQLRIKAKKFVINPKFVFTNQNEGFLEKCDFTGPRSYFHSNQNLKNIKDNGFFQQKQIFFEILASLLWFPKKCK